MLEVNALKPSMTINVLHFPAVLAILSSSTKALITPQANLFLCIPNSIRLESESPDFVISLWDHVYSLVVFSYKLIPLIIYNNKINFNNYVRRVVIVLLYLSL